MKLTAFATCLQRLWMALVLFAGLAAPLAAVAGEISTNAGKGRFEFTGWAGPPLPVWYQLPETITPDTPVVVVMHGVNRDADRYRDEWAELALAHRFIVIVPEYSRTDFPGSDGYNTGFFTSADGTPRPRNLWSFAAIEPLFDEVRRRFGTAVPRYTLYGHSAGAQFVHRYVMFMPEARIEQAIAANAGWYTMPDPALAFPYGVKGAPVTTGARAELLCRRPSLGGPDGDALWLEGRIRPRCRPQERLDGTGRCQADCGARCRRCGTRACHRDGLGRRSPRPL